MNHRIRATSAAVLLLGLFVLALINPQVVRTACLVDQTTIDIEQDTVRALWVYARFPDGDDGVECDSTDWPDPDSIPPWSADSLLEDVDSPSIFGSLSHFFYEMSNENHVLKGAVLDHVILMPDTIGAFAIGDMWAELAAIGNVVADSVVAYLGADYLHDHFDLNGDDLVDHLFIYLRSTHSTSGTQFEYGSGHNQTFNPIPWYSVGARDSIGFQTYNLLGPLPVTLPDSTVFQYRDRYEQRVMGAHEYGHALGWGHNNAMGEYCVMDGVPPNGDRRPGKEIFSQAISGTTEGGWSLLRWTQRQEREIRQLSLPMERMSGTTRWLSSGPI